MLATPINLAALNLKILTSLSKLTIIHLVLSIKEKFLALGLLKPMMVPLH